MATSPGSGSAAADSTLRRPGVVLGCRELAPLTAAKLTRARAFFDALPSLFEVETELIEAGTALLVYTIPVENLAAAQKKLLDFKRQGFENIAIIGEGPQRLGMSFGLLNSEPAARAMVENLTSRGVRNLRIVERDTSRHVLRYRFVAGDSGLPSEVRQRLASVNVELGVTPSSCDSRNVPRQRP